MKKPVLAVLGVAGACAACCAIPLAIPLIGGLSLAGAGFMGWESLSTGAASLPLGAGLLASAAALIWLWIVRRRKNACLSAPATQAGVAAANACAISSGGPEAQACACAGNKA